MGKLLTVPEAADLVRLTKWGIYSLVRQGRLPAIKLGGRMRFRAEDLEAALTAARVQPLPGQSQPRPGRARHGAFPLKRSL